MYVTMSSFIFIDDYVKVRQFYYSSLSSVDRFPLYCMTRFSLTKKDQPQNLPERERKKTFIALRNPIVAEIEY